jgi:WD40 repeat protein
VVLLFWIAVCTLALAAKASATGEPKPASKEPSALAAKRLHSFKSKQIVYAIAFDVHAKLLAFGDFDGVIAVHETGSGKEVTRFGCTKPVKSLALLNGGTRLAALVNDTPRDPLKKPDQINPNRFWEVGTWLEVDSAFRESPGDTFPGVWRMDGKERVVPLAIGVPIGGKRRGIIRVFDYSTSKTREFPSGVLFSRGALLNISSDGKIVAGHDGLKPDIYLWDMTTEKQVGVLKCPTKPQAFCLSPIGDYLATSGALENKVRIWDTKAEKLLHTIEVGYSPTGLAFSPDGSVLAIGATGAVTFRSVKTPEEVLALKLDSKLTPVAVQFNSKGSMLAVAIGPSVQQWEIKPPLAPKGDAKVPAK